MPQKNKTLCYFPGCNEVVERGYCERHKKQTNRSYRRRIRESDSAAVKYYHSKEWNKVRDAKLERNPLCEMCEHDGYIKPASLVHHIKPVIDGGDSSADNLMSLCASCHNKVHSEKGKSSYKVRNK
jgi:5-methylcytosine-specific restriction protein A